MKYPRILAAIRSARWAVTPATLQAISDTLSARLTGRLASDMGDDMEDGGEDCAPYQMAGLGVAVVQLRGIIGRNLSGMEMACGGCDIAKVEENLTRAVADPSVAAVVLEIDSPGGTVGGVAEFAAKIEQLAAESGKAIVAYASGQCCSAAYWIACGCNGIVASPSSDVGSIGVYIALVDESENWAKEGYKLVLIKAGEHKAAGISGSKITDEQIKLWQADVDSIYSEFTSAVKAARLSAGVSVSEDVMQGQTFYGARAVSAGLADRIASSLPEVAAMLAPIPRGLSAS